MINKIKSIFKKKEQGIKVFCRDNMHKPDEIPNNLWLKKKEYTLKDCFVANGGALCFILEEIDLEAAKIEVNGYMYRGFNSSRFQISYEDLIAIQRMANTPTNFKYLTKKEIKEKLEKCVENEDFENAAKYRDLLLKP